MIARRPGRGAGFGSLLALAAAFLVGCTSGPAQVDNATDIPVSLFVDGGWVGTFAAGASGNASISGQGRPMTLEVRSPSDAVLLSMIVNDDQLADAARGGFGNGSSVGLPCGIVAVVIGQLAPDAALAPAEAVPPGPCP